tara:strand:- start:41 stop:283 length:243 start_codon:yes stop_codon:yes gene_type:complete
MNWMEIDKLLYSMISIYSDKDLLYSDVKKKFGWTDSQVQAAVGPLLQRVELNKIEEPTPIKKKRVVKPIKKKTAKKGLTV